MTKKNIILGIKLLTAVLLVLGGVVAYNYWNEANYPQTVQNLLERITNDAKREFTDVGSVENRVDENVTLAYYPLKDNEPIDKFKKGIDTLLPLVSQEQHKIKSMYYVSKPFQNNMTLYELHQINYDEFFSQFFASDPKILLTHYDKGNGELLGFNELFDNLFFDEDPILDILHKDIDATQLSEDVKQRLKAGFKIESFKDILYAYTAKALEVVLVDNSTVYRIPISLPNLVNYFKKEYIYPEYLDIYNSNIETVLENRAVVREDKLKKIEQVIKDKTPSKRIALTFDDGPNPYTTPRLLDVLKQHEVKATFFIVGQRVAGNDEILKRELAEGHELGNHSWSHPNLITLPMEEAKEEVEKTQNIIKEVTGTYPATLRPPYGSINKEYADSIGLPILLWDVDSEDWASHNVSAIHQRVLSTTREGSIILLHDIHEESVDAVEGLILALKEQGYEFVTVSELFNTNELMSGLQYLNEADAYVVPSGHAQEDME